VEKLSERLLHTYAAGDRWKREQVQVAGWASRPGRGQSTGSTSSECFPLYSFAVAGARRAKRLLELLVRCQRNSDQVGRFLKKLAHGAIKGPARPASLPAARRTAGCRPCSHSLHPPEGFHRRWQIVSGRPSLPPGVLPSALTMPTSRSEAEMLTFYIPADRGARPFPFFPPGARRETAAIALREFPGKGPGPRCRKERRFDGDGLPEPHSGVRKRP